MSAIRLRRLCFGLAALLIGAALFNVWYFPAEAWFADAVVQTAGLLAICWAALIVVLEVIAHSSRSARAQWFLAVYAITPLFVTAALCRGAWFGRDYARFDTWHLLVLFSVIHFIVAMVFATMVVGLGAFVGFLRSRRAD